ncbi:response regulator transcription factor [Rhizobium leguminosarum]|uniref:response regulator transcription factor n=1 Tax=Rhizobium leguminosarum TaxID=384 RepID=UPI001AE3A139|nr:response regulator transcription factor [Rhizobium leguminosarum]MBP2449463.1 two-component system response regulator AdeR [Rhizobium leguminosarum]
MRNKKILIIDDDRETCDGAAAYFRSEGCRTEVATNAKMGLMHHSRLKPDLVILDVGLPDGDGFDVLTEIKRRGGNTLVIMLTGRIRPDQQLQGLNCGVDDYITKPCDWPLLVARSKAVINRASERAAFRIIRLGRLTIDSYARTVSVDQPAGPQDVDLTPTEFKLMEHMARFPRRAFGRAELIDACCQEVPLERTIDSHMKNLRSKLKNAGADNMLVSIRGFGYRLDNTID